ncbi:MAG: hypothetical protein C4308_00755 [Chitinophagaceae bacterium]
MPLEKYPSKCFSKKSAFEFFTTVVITVAVVIISVAISSVVIVAGKNNQYKERWVNNFHR